MRLINELTLCHCAFASRYALFEKAKTAAIKFVCAVMLCSILMLTGCGGKPFNVKPRPDVSSASYDTSAQSGGVTIQAQALTDEDFLYETFDANLILAGILPVRVMVTNSSDQPLELKKAKFEVKDAGNRNFKQVDARRAFKKLISYYQISTYSKSGYKESQQDFASHSLDVSTALAPGQSRQGLLFFTMPEGTSNGGLTLVARKVAPKQSKSDQIVELKLN